MSNSTLTLKTSCVDDGYVCIVHLVTLDTVQVSMALIGSVTSASIFLLLLLLWAVLLIIERFSEFCLHVQTMAKNCTRSPICFLYSHKVGMEFGLYVFFLWRVQNRFQSIVLKVYILK